jgi:hypothetical protein
MAFALRDGPLACAIKFSLGLTWNNLPPSRGQGTLHFKLRFILWYKFIFIDLLIYIYIYIYIYILVLLLNMLHGLENALPT